jgi:hypothetical protein
MEKPKLYVIGSSHAARLYNSLKTNKINQKYDVINLSKPGSTFKDIVYPQSIKNTDVILGQLFGNDVFERNIKITQGRLNKTIHLTKFSPIPLSTLEKIFKKFIEKMSIYPCKIYLFDLILRHIGCCSDHSHSLLVKHQRNVNSLLKRTVQGSNIKLLNHLRYLKLRIKWTSRIRNYKTLFVDTVHFHPLLYKTMVEQVLEKELF